MFVSYFIVNHGYGYMCFREGTSISYIYDFLNDVMLDKASIIFASNYSTRPVHFIDTFRDGKYKIEKYNKSLASVDEIGDLYTYFYGKYDKFTSIIGYY